MAHVYANCASGLVVHLRKPIRCYLYTPLRFGMSICYFHKLHASISLIKGQHIKQTCPQCNLQTWKLHDLQLYNWVRSRPTSSATFTPYELSFFEWYAICIICFKRGWQFLGLLRVNWIVWMCAFCEIMRDIEIFVRIWCTGMTSFLEQFSTNHMWSCQITTPKLRRIRCASSITFSLGQQVAKLGQINETMSIDISYIGRFGSINKTMDNKFYYIVGKKVIYQPLLATPFERASPTIVRDVARFLTHAASKNRKTDGNGTPT